MNQLESFIENKLTAVVRGANVQNIIPIVRALKNGGVMNVEITLETPKGYKLIELVADQFGEEIILGAGTVLDPETARIAIMSGARFIFSPTINRETIKIAKRYGVVSIPGALTPTEILTAYENGADIVKVFPANVYGAKYLKDIHGPLSQIPLMPTGGIELNNVSEYIKAGAVAIGVGSSLVDTKRLSSEKEYRKLELEAMKFIQVVKETTYNRQF